MSSFVRRSSLAVVATVLAAAYQVCAAESPIVLRDVTRSTGVAFQHTDGSSGRRYIVEYVASGMATFDYDGDGLIDLYFLNGALLPGTRADRPPRDALYRNLGGFRFADVTEQAGVGDTGFGRGVAAADYNNDGFPDLYLNQFGPNVLYRNRGDGTFADATRHAGVDRGSKVGAGTCFLDIDGDGDLDLYVANYVNFTFETHVSRRVMGQLTYASPMDYAGVPDNLFRNQGDGTFADISRESGIAAYAGTGMGLIAADFDDDGDTDIFVANDVMPNFLFRNDGRGRFDEVGLLSGVAYEASGTPHGNMGVECADFDRDGRLDFFVTAYHREPPVLYRNLGGGLFDDVTRITGAGQGSFAHVKWGCGMVDFDNDGWKDLFIACGHFDDNIALRDDTTSYMVRPVLLRNIGGRFVDVSSSAGDGVQVLMTGRGAAFDDLDNDGRIDVVVLNSRRGPTILRNESPGGNHWVALRLRGVRCNHDGVGSRVKVVSGDLVQVDEVHAGRSYQSHYGARLHFGLGKHTKVDRIEVRWLGGRSEVFENLPADQILVLNEGEGRPLAP
jgi:hypothetical protein